MEPTLPEGFLRAVSEGFPEDFLTLDPEERAFYGRDATRVREPRASAVALPRSTEEVSLFLALCDRSGVAVVPSGGRTGLAGGALAVDGEVVLSLSRMRRMDPVDVLGETCRVQAGAVTEAVHQHCAAHGLTWPVDFASKGSSQVGGNIATNAGGVRVVRYGLTRSWVLGLQVVTAQGAVLELNGALEKNNTGLDLRQLFIGSEGTLGVITEATLKLARLPRASQVLLLAASGVPAVLGLLRAAREAPFTLAAFEFFTDRCLARVQRHRGLRAPLGEASPCYVLLELEEPDRDAVERWAAELLERGLASDGTVARDGSQAAQLWALRESISESLAATGLPHKNDVALPIAALEGFCAALEGLLSGAYPGWELCLFGHVGDGNLHINVMKPEGLPREDFLARTHAVDRELFALVSAWRGSISAEHGVGLLKKPHLHFSRSPEELSLLRAVKRALDPRNTLNPGKILDV
ncbi:MAG: FAD-binding oxidoreductase [Deltaproteobacteria bacterium]|nr:FAD-binding oxidoreductase [Deltaproteobacteria bacterium]